MMPGPPPETTAKPESESSASDFFGQVVIGRTGLDAGAAEDGNRRAHRRQPLGRLDELCHNPEDPPGLTGRGIGDADKGSAIFGNLSFALMALPVLFLIRGIRRHAPTATR
jgi:hypothetical protein